MNNLSCSDERKEKISSGSDKEQDKTRKIYTLNGLQPEIVAVTFAKCSRSPECFNIIAKELNSNKSSEFHEKWVVGYGHSSIAEHAVLSIAIENVSILATKVIEDNRLASYTEKSTRYQVFNKNRYYKPKIIMESDLGRLYEQTADQILEKYNSLFPTMMEFWKDRFPKEEGISDKMYETQLKNKALDALRYMLPVAVLTNLGMTINARQLEHGIVKMLSHPLKELQEIGEEIKEKAMEITPTLVKYTKKNSYISETPGGMEKLAVKKVGKTSGEEPQAAVLVEYDKDAEDKIVTALIYRFSNQPYEKIKEKVMKMSVAEKDETLNEAIGKVDKYDIPIRELEHTYYTFDVLMDYGAFRDLQRHRVCTQTNQEFSVDHGYCTPPEIIEAGLKSAYDECMSLSVKAYKEISKRFPKEAQYIIPLAFKKRTLFKMNLRECFHIIRLRTGKMAHASYKRIAQEMYLEIKKVHPLLAKYLQVSLE